MDVKMTSAEIRNDLGYTHVIVHRSDGEREVSSCAFCQDKMTQFLYVENENGPDVIGLCEYHASVIVPAPTSVMLIEPDSFTMLSWEEVFELQG